MLSGGDFLAVQLHDRVAPSLRASGMGETAVVGAPFGAVFYPPPGFESPHLGNPPDLPGVPTPLEEVGDGSIRARLHLARFVDAFHRESGSSERDDALTHVSHIPHSVNAER